MSDLKRKLTETVFGTGSASFALFEADTSRLSTQRTFVIFGMMRGGTTAVTTVVRDLGLFVGTDIGNNLEDREFYVPPDQMGPVVRARNTEHAVWGFKHPRAGVFMPSIFEDLRNPRFICVTRDLGGNVLGIKKDDPGRETLKTAQLTAHRTVQNMNTIAKLACPTLIVSYEKLLLKPEAVILEMATFVNLPCTRSQSAEIAKKIVPGRYQKIERTTWQARLARIRRLTRLE